MLHFHTLEVAEVRPETSDAVSVSFKVPPELESEYRYRQGQHIALRTRIDGQEVRRTYSICSAVEDRLLRVVIKRQEGGGLFSDFANEKLEPGQTLDVLTPTGSFHTDLDAQSRRSYVGFAAGSGITPLISIIKTTLSNEPDSRFVLFYGNRTTSSIIFHEDLEDLKNQYLERFAVHFFLTREARDVELYNGRLDKQKCHEILETLCPVDSVDEFFVCGPSTMIEDVTESLQSAGVDKKRIHFERFTTALARKKPEQRKKSRPVGGQSAQSRVAVILDGMRTEFSMDYDGDSLLDAALEHGADLPFSCKGGVCCTCRAKLKEGKVDMAANYALEPHELEAGFILACQARPVTDRVVIDYDQN